MALTAKVREAVLFSGPCAYCGNFNPTQVDHILPVSRGGTDDWDNLTPACKPCNMEKLDFTPEEWREYREAEGLGWPPVPWYETPEILAIFREWKESNPGKPFPRLNAKEPS